MAKSIPLTRGLVATVDDEDYAALAPHKWCAVPGNRTFYAVRNLYTPGQGQRHFRMHDAILGSAPGHFVDHVDGDGLNNQRSNLRFATCAQNNQNRRKRLGTSSAFKGVTWVKARGKWRASIEVGYKAISLGSFADEKAAACAYDRAAREHFGSFARLNFDDPLAQPPPDAVDSP